jgi:hypothetical protein
MCNHPYFTGIISRDDFRRRGIRPLEASGAHSSKQAPFTFDSDCVDTAHDTYVNIYDTLPKVVGFFRVFRFPPTGNVDRVCWDYPHIGIITSLTLTL